MRLEVTAALSAAFLLASSALAAEPVKPPAGPAPAAPGKPGAPGPAAGGPPGMPPPLQLAPVEPGKAPEKPGKYSKAQVKRGGELVAFGGCNDCHTPWVFNPQAGAPVPDMTRMLSGHPHDAPDPYSDLKPGDIGVIGPTFTSFKLPFGIVYTANLTPDVETGSGSWTEEMFLKIFRTAKHLGGNGRPVLPPMPWYTLTTLSDADLKSIFAYLRSIPPIKNGVPSPKVPEPVMGHIDMGNQAQLKAMAAQKK
jgi:mono/diheme cytochrome c family protein